MKELEAKITIAVELETGSATLNVLDTDNQERIKNDIDNLKGAALLKYINGLVAINAITVS
jgi:hypothetical protein